MFFWAESFLVFVGEALSKLGLRLFVFVCVLVSLVVSGEEG